MAFPLSRLSHVALFHLKRTKFVHKHASVLSHLINVTKLRYKSTFAKNLDIHKITNLEDLLNSSNKDITPLDAVNMLTVLSKWTGEGKIKSNEFTNDNRFTYICEIFALNCYHLSSSMSVAGVKSLLEIGIGIESNHFKHAEDTILDKAPYMNLKPLILFLNSYCQFKTIDSERIIRQICKEIGNRQDELIDLADALKILECKYHLHKSFLTDIEMCTLCLIDKGTVADLHKLLCVLAKVNLRSAILIPAICSKMSKDSEKLNGKQIVNTLYAMNTLKILDSALLHKLSNDLLLEIPEIQKVNLISSILTCFGQLRWRHSDILDTCGEWIVNNLDSCRPRDFATYVITLANLNYIPKRSNEIFNSILPKLSRTDVFNDSVWLDVVWSLAVLKIASNDQIDAVLQPEFYEQLIGQGEFKNISTKRKLQNLQALLKLQTGSSISLFQSSFLPDIEIPTNESAKQKLPVLEALSSLVLKKKFMITNISNQAGILIDAEFIIDKKGKPVQIEQYGINAVDNNTKTLPDGYQRIALFIWDFKDLTLNSRKLIGSNELSKRILTQFGYTIIEISHDEMEKLNTGLDRVKFVQKKIMEKVQKAV